MYEIYCPHSNSSEIHWKSLVFHLFVKHYCVPSLSLGTAVPESEVYDLMEIYDEQEFHLGRSARRKMKPSTRKRERSRTGLLVADACSVDSGEHTSVMLRHHHIGSCVG